jgi:hypothetical protein
VFNPRRASRAPQLLPDEFARPCSSPKRVFFSLGELGERPGAVRRAGHPHVFFVRAQRPGRVSFGDFSLHEQRKVTCRGSTTHKF